MIVIKPGSPLLSPTRHSQSPLSSLIKTKCVRQWGEGGGARDRDPPLTGRGEEEIKNINYSTSWLLMALFII